MLGYKIFKDFPMGYENLKEIWMGHEFFGEKSIFPSTSVLGINNDQSLICFEDTLLFMINNLDNDRKSLTAFC